MTTFLASIPSPPQGVWHLGWLPIRAYALFIIVGIIVALVIGDRRWVARGGEPGVIYDIALWAVPFGLIGGRLYHVMTDWRTYFGEEGAGLLAALRIWDGGLGIWGAVALGGIGAWIGCRQRGVPLPAFGDAIAPGIVLAQAIGRLGNYFNQELFGRPTSLPWGLKIYERRDASGALDMLNGVSTGQPADIAPHPVHPTFLYELIWNVLVFLLLIYVDRRFKMGHGRLFASYVAAYCVGRFGVELLRDDTATLIAGVRINLFTSTFVFIGAVVYIVLAPKGREDPATLAGKPHEVEEVEEESPPAVTATDEIPAGSEDSALVEWTRELAAVASTTGVVAGVAVAVEDEDAEEAEEEAREAAEAAAGADGSHDEAAETETAVLEKVSAPSADSDFDSDEEGEGEPQEEQVAELAEPEAEAEAEAPPAEEAVEEPAEAGEAETEALAVPKPRKWLRRLVSRKPRPPSRQPAVTESEIETAQVASTDESAIEPEAEAAALLDGEAGEVAGEPEVGAEATDETVEAKEGAEPEAAERATEPEQPSAERPDETETQEAAEPEAEAEAVDETVEGDEGAEPEAEAFGEAPDVAEPSAEETESRRPSPRSWLSPLHHQR